MRTALCCFSILLSTIAVAQPNIEWQKCLGGSAGEALFVQPCPDGGYLLAGGTGSNDGDVTGNNGGSSDGWIVKLNSAGGVQWQKCFGGTSSDWFLALRTAADGGYVLTGVTVSNDGDVSGNHGLSDVWVLKIDDEGELQWQKCLGGSDGDAGVDIRQTADGGYIVCGETSSSDGDVSFNHGSSDVWVTKLDASGGIQWEKTFGGPSEESANSIQQTADGGYVIVGGANTDGGDVTGTHGQADIWVLKIDDLGGLEWQKAFGGSYSDYGDAVLQTNDGGYLVAGNTTSVNGDVSGNHGYEDGWLIKLNVNGAVQWQKCLGGSNYDGLSSVIQLNDGNLLLAGNTASNDGNVTEAPIGDHDIWVLKLTPNGNILWQDCLGGYYQEVAINAQPTNDGGYIVTGQTRSNDGEVSGNHNPINDGYHDAWVVKLTHCTSTPIVTNLAVTPDLPVPAPCGGTASLNPTGGTPPYSFLWSDGDTNVNRSGLCAGTFTVTVSDVAGCAQVDTAKINDFVSVEALHTGFSIHPNPVNDVLQVKASKSLGDIKVTNAIGQSVLQQHVLSGNATIDLSKLSSGIYFLSFHNRYCKIIKR